jgi:hypothetical protein
VLRFSETQLAYISRFFKKNIFFKGKRRRKGTKKGKRRRWGKGKERKWKKRE